ncbi:unnamed protein product [Ostreobium quekettii]|uniref:Transcriptional regulator n=1 Tax=Ostreobium quekettii TaxID=121088 RepID=A0A8S1JFQ2_9CHLO|nr:unnamed protein product [Ostreobium quekettii]
MLTELAPLRSLLSSLSASRGVLLGLEGCCHRLWSGLDRVDAQRRHAISSSAPRLMGRKSLKIAGRKTAMDERRAKLYGKYGKLICQAARKNGTDPLTNLRLRDVLEEAKRAYVPKEIIDRNMNKAMDKSQGDYQEVVYEAYGPGGTGFIMECLTDNLNRTASDIRAIIGRAGGKMANKGSVLFNFERLGTVMVEGHDLREEQVLECAMDAGAQDVKTCGLNRFKILTSIDEYTSIMDRLAQNGLPVIADQCGLAYVPTVAVQVSGEDLERNQACESKLLALDDVDAVYTTCEEL